MAVYEPDLRYFAEQLESIRTQSHADWVCLVSCDSQITALRASRILDPYFSDRRFRWEENADRLGHRRNFERAIARAASLDVTIVACADQDDIWHRHKLERLIARIDAAPPLSLVHSDMERLRDGTIEHESVWRASQQSVRHDRLEDVLVTNVVTGCTMLFDVELARRFPVIPESFGFHDHWYAALAAAHGGIHRVDEPLVQYRQHGANVVGTSDFDWRVRLPGLAGVRGELAACAARWSVVRDRIEDLEAVGVRLAGLRRLMLLSPMDLGLSLILRGVILSYRSPKLSRYLIRIGIGKLVALVAPGLRTRRPNQRIHL